MRRRLWTGFYFCTLVLAACGATPPRAEAPDEAAVETATAGSAAGDEPDAEEASSETTTSDEGALALPTECAGSADSCSLPPKYAKALCQDVYPDIALHLFHKGTPWRRAYLTRNTKAWNASGGASASEEELLFDEEVLILIERKSNLGGMQVSGAGGGYEAMRWNGSCVTLSSEELTRTHPPKAKTAKVEWRFLGDAMQEALRSDEALNAAYRARRNECKGAVSGSVSLKCVKADTKLSDSIVQYVRDGRALGEPGKRP